MFLEKKLKNWVETHRARGDLPLRLELWNGQRFDMSRHAPAVTLRIPHVSAIPYLLSPSLANLGKAYVEGKIDIEGKLEQVIRVGSALAAHGSSDQRRLPRFARHGRRQDAAAIQYHYDVSNDFYRAWLDENMVYSCAYFEHGTEDLATAQQKKIDHILTKLQLKPNQRLLDIGCGWGALVLRAAQKYGARCVGITLSQAQFEWAREQVRAAGLQGRIEIRLQDYRDVEGSFDRISSVGMFEHVGIRNLGAYFRRMQQLLADDGLAMNHGITSTSADSAETNFGAGEFIDRYVFPQGELPHVSLVLREMQEAGLETLDVENLRRHYARTCAAWAGNFEAAATYIRSLVDERRFRIWRVYLAGSAHGFEQDWIAIYQVLCAKARRSSNALPWSRRFMYP